MVSDPLLLQAGAWLAAAAGVLGVLTVTGFLLRWGIRAVVGESFAEIFYGNCLALGIPCLQASSEEIDALQNAAEAAPQSSANISLEPAAIEIDGRSWGLGMAADAKNRLLGGQWDATSQLLRQEQALQNTAARLPYMRGFVASC